MNKKKGNKTMKKFYEEMNERISVYGKNRDAIIKEYETKIEQSKRDIAQAEKDMDEAVENDNINSYAEKKNIVSMKKQMLNSLENGLHNVKNYPAMLVSEHTALKEELKNYTLSALTEKYSKILELLNEGEVLLDEFEAIVKEYYDTFEKLDDKVAGFEEDETGAKYKTIGSSADDYCSVHPKLNEIFRHDGIHSVKQMLQNKIENRYFN